MEAPAYAVAAELAHDGEPLAFGKGLDGKADIAEANTGLDAHDALPHGFKSDAAQAFGSNGDIANHVHPAVVAKPALFGDHGDINVHDVAFFKRLVVRYAVANHVIERCAK